MKKVLSVVGARPNFIKLAALHPHLCKNFNHIIIHTGQHYDLELSRYFFDELEIPEPNYNLHAGSATHGMQTARIISGCEKILLSEKPDVVLVYGDTNSTLGGALAAAKLHIPTAHVEAGMRSYDRSMPEEINRVITDHISSLLLCPSDTAAKFLKKEGVTKNVFVTGDIMYDIFLKTNPDYSALKENTIQGEYFFTTIHRQENTNNKVKLKCIFEALNSLNRQVVIPVHPRTEKSLRRMSVKTNNLKLIKPVKYSQCIALQQQSRKVITDSGGIQKEAYWLKVPCITIRDSTEWPETVSSGWNILVDPSQTLIEETVKNFKNPQTHPDFYGEGKASAKIVSHLKNYL